MSLSDELEAEASIKPPSQRSQIDVFLETFNEQERAEVEEWIQSGKSKTVLFRVLKRRGLPVANSTFRNWANGTCR